MIAEDPVLELELAGVELIPDADQDAVLESTEKIGKVELLVDLGLGEAVAGQLFQDLPVGQLGRARTTAGNDRSHRYQHRYRGASVSEHALRLEAPPQRRSSSDHGLGSETLARLLRARPLVSPAGWI